MALWQFPSLEVESTTLKWPIQFLMEFFRSFIFTIQKKQNRLPLTINYLDVTMNCKCKCITVTIFVNFYRFYVEAADPDLILFKSNGCHNQCNDLPDVIPLMLSVSDGSRLPAVIFLTINFEKSTIIDVPESITVDIDEYSEEFPELVRVKLDDQRSDEVSFSIDPKSTVFYIQPGSGVISVLVSTNI